MSSFCLKGQNTETITPKFLIDGYFFKTKPEALPQEFETAFPPLKDKDGNKVSCIRYLNGAKLSDWSKERAIPLNQVKNGKELLELAKNAKYMRTKITSTPAITTGENFPLFSEKDINGNIIDSNQVKGKYFLINFWYIGCGPCIKEMPGLSKWKDKYPHILFMSATYNKAEEAQPIIEKQRFNYTHLVEISDNLLNLVGSSGYPLTVIVDNTGKVIQVESGTSPKQLYDIEQTLNSIPGK